MQVDYGTRLIVWKKMRNSRIIININSKREISRVRIKLLDDLSNKSKLLKYLNTYIYT